MYQIWGFHSIDLQWDLGGGRTLFTEQSENTVFAKQLAPGFILLLPKPVDTDAKRCVRPSFKPTAGEKAQAAATACLACLMPKCTVPKAIPKFHRLTQSYYKSVFVLALSSFVLALAFVTTLACVVQVYGQGRSIVLWSE